MKVVHITIAYYPRIGGMQNAVQELAERTAKIGHDVTVITSSFKDSKKTERNGNLTIHRLWNIKINRVPDIMPTLPFKLLGVIDNKTIVHLHYVLNPCIDLALVLSKIKGAKIVSHIHLDPLPSGLFGFLNPPYKKFFWKNLLPLSDNVICPTADYVDIAKHYRVPETKCVIVPSGVDTTRFKRKTSSDISFPVKILFVGRLNKQKNVPRLLEAFKLFQQTHKAVLRVIGEGIERKTIEDFIRDNHISDVIMEGSMVGEKLTDAYASSDIFVLPSDYESFGIVNLEAMASGLPIIASDIPGVRNLLADSSMLVKPTPEDFAAAMIKLTENPQLRQELISKGLEKVKDYDWDKITEKVIDIYREISD
jgi:glycosyltransferase involved in cell wall biosynthesis